MPRVRFHVTPLPPALTPMELCSAWRNESGPIALDSGRGLSGWTSGAPSRFSLVSPGPVQKEAPVSIAEVRALARSLEVQGGLPPGPFAGGFLGALSYDLGVEGEEQNLPRDPWRSPLIVGGLVTDFAVFDHDAGEAWLVLGEGIDPRTVEERRERLLGQVAEPGPSRPLGPLLATVEPGAHIARIEEARRRIGEGDFYQVNLAQRFEREVEGHPVDHFLALREANPGAYHAFVAWEGGALLSTSPELLLETVGPKARTTPIKGTIARATDEGSDAGARAALLASEKDRAELAMIVDLERNDLGRVCEIGSVEAKGFPRLESYRHLHHLVADVTGTLRPGADGGDALAALFPGGSITGAPKLASMEAIAELEGEGRGFFTGSAGFLDSRGNAAWNILIRTMVWRGDWTETVKPGCPLRGEVSLHVGSGITWSSDPGAEEAETRLKAKALLEALDSPSQADSGSKSAPEVLESR